MKIFSFCFLLLIKTCGSEMPYWYWYATQEEIDALKNGMVQTLDCPVGSYRDVNYGVGQAGCIPCPPGRYGSSIHLIDSMCTAACPRGTYLDRAGGKSVSDCRPCPRGTFGDTEGLTRKKCSGKCTDLNTVKTKYHGTEVGLTSRSECKVCPEGYLDVQAQCDNKQSFLETNAPDAQQRMLEYDDAQ